MKTLLYATGNSAKFRTASAICNQHGIKLQQLTLDIPEIQSLDGEVVARDKALRIFEEMQKPVLSSDDVWLIPGLRDFPGPFMKFVNKSFTVDDWLRLTKDLPDRRIILRQYVVYQDSHDQRLFHTGVEGMLLKEPRGDSIYPHATITSFDGGKTSAAEALSDGASSIVKAGRHTSWHDFCEWYVAQAR